MGKNHFKTFKNNKIWNIPIPQQISKTVVVLLTLHILSKALNIASAALVLWWKKESGDIWNSKWFASSTIKGSPKISSNGDCSWVHRECLLF